MGKYEIIQTATISYLYTGKDTRTRIYIKPVTFEQGQIVDAEIMVDYKGDSHVVSQGIDITEISEHVPQPVLMGSEKVEGVKSYLEQYKKPIIITSASIVLIIVGILAYKKFK